MRQPMLQWMRVVLGIALLASVVCVSGVYIPDRHTRVAATTAPTFTLTCGAAGESPNPVAPGSTARLQASATSNQSYSNANTIFDVFNSTGSRVYYFVQHNVNFTAGVAQPVAGTWPVPSTQPAGPYTLKFGVFTSTWGTLYAYTTCTTFVVGSGSTATSTPATADPASTPVTADTPATADPASTPVTADTPATADPASTPVTADTPATADPASTPATTAPVPPTATSVLTQPPTQAPTQVPTSTPSQSASPLSHFGTLPPGSALPDDATCASEVRRSSFEPRPDNYTANHTVPSAAEEAQIQNASWSGNGMDGATSDAYLHRVTGNFTGTTDEIIQWAACKWGIDEDVVRAQAVKESSWHQNYRGDYTQDSSLCPPGTWDGSGCYQSYGLLQIKYHWVPFTWPLSRNDTAFNVDYAYAWWRNCYEGHVRYLYGLGGYGPGDLWGCVGFWYSGRWYDSGAQTYIGLVQNNYNTKPWLQPGF